MTDNSPVVFIHYSWDNEPHKKWVMFLSKRLLADGVEIVFDRYDLKLGSNNNYFMEKIQASDKVILIMTPDYKRKAENRTSGIGYEYQILTTEISRTLATNNKFIPVLRQGTKEDSIPLLFQSFLFLNITNDKLFEEKYLELLKNIYDEPLFPKPAKGDRPDFKKLEKQLQNQIEPNYLINDSCFVVSLKSGISGKKKKTDSKS